MAKLEVDTITLPAFLASALVNGDESGLEAADEKVLARVYAVLGDWEVVDVVRDADGNAEESRFTWCYGDSYCGDAKGGDVLDYVIHRYVKTESVRDKLMNNWLDATNESAKEAARIALEWHDKSRT